MIETVLRVFLVLGTGYAILFVIDLARDAAFYPNPVKDTVIEIATIGGTLLFFLYMGWL